MKLLARRLVPINVVRRWAARDVADGVLLQKAILELLNQRPGSVVIGSFDLGDALAFVVKDGAWLRLDVSTNTNCEKDLPERLGPLDVFEVMRVEGEFNAPDGVQVVRVGEGNINREAKKLIGLELVIEQGEERGKGVRVEVCKGSKESVCVTDPIRTGGC